jgi:LysM repeat protein
VTVRRILAVLAVLLVLQVLTASMSYAAPLPTCSFYHQVRSGETLFSIGRLYNVTPYAISSVNSLWDPNVIYVGQNLCIPSGPPYWDGVPGTCPTCPSYGSWNCTYTVQRYDNLYRISLRYGVSMWDLAQHNGIFNLDYIWVGQRLYVPCCGDC